MEKEPWLSLSVVSAEGKLARSCSVQLRFPQMVCAQQVVRGDLGPSRSRVPELPICFQIHDFAITRHYAIIMDLPLMFDPQVMVCLRFLIATPHFA